MSWTDKKAIQTILKLRDEFKVTDFIETGTFKGTNAKLYSQYFQNVFSCEINENYYKEAKEKCKDYENIKIYNIDSPSFLTLLKYKGYGERLLTSSTSIWYLDAHFYDSTLSKEKRFVILDELKALSDFVNCIIVIHDFDCGCENLGHIVYDGIPLNFDLLEERLAKVNPNFKYYTNSKEFCDIVKLEDVLENKIQGIESTEDVLDNLKYVWSSPEKTYRGILYCLPRGLDLSKYDLKELI
jgi:hypothetical protein